VNVQDCDILVLQKWRGLLHHFAIVFEIRGELFVIEAFPPRARMVRWEEYRRKWIATATNSRILRNDVISPIERARLEFACVAQIGDPYGWALNFGLKLRWFKHCVELIGRAQINAYGPNTYGGKHPARITPADGIRVSLGLGWKWTQKEIAT